MMFIVFVIMLALIIMLLPWVFSGTITINDADGYLKFNSFLEFYNLNPNRWDLYDGYVKFCKESYYYSSNNIKYCFKLIDFYRYKIWKRKKEKYDSKTKQNKKYQEMIDILKKDIENSKKK